MLEMFMRYIFETERKIENDKEIIPFGNLHRIKWTLYELQQKKLFGNLYEVKGK